MPFSFRCWLSPRWLGAIAVVLVPAALAAAPRNRAAPESDQVEMFQAMADGAIDVKVIPKDSTQVRVMIKNNTDKPLSVKLPEAFAAVPVLGQAGAGAAGGAGRAAGGGGSANQQNQGIGGGMGGGGGGGGGVGGGFFNVAPEAVGQIKAATVCLEHGKTEPKAAVPYEIRPLESFTSNPQVQEVCKLLGQGAVNQRVAQVAAWHLNNNMSWEQLANKQLRYANGQTSPYFSPQEIRAAMQLVSVATHLAEEHAKQAPAQQQSAVKGTSQDPTLKN